MEIISKYEDKISVIRAALSDLHRYYFNGRKASTTDESNKTAARLMGHLEYYPVTTRGRTTYEVIIEWIDHQTWRSEEAKEIKRSLDNTLNDALTKFLKKQPNL